MRPGAAAAVVAALLLALWAPGGWEAVAGHRVIRDANDTRGLMDVRQVANSGGRYPRFKMTMYRRWSNQAAWDRAFQLVWLDTFGSRRYDYYALVTSNGIRLNGMLFRDRKERPDRFIKRLTVTRPGPRSMKVRVPLPRLYFPGTALIYRWYAKTLFSSRRCPAVCIDRVPDSGGVIEPKEPVPPTPSPSPSPTISPPSLSKH